MNRKPPIIAKKVSEPAVGSAQQPSVHAVATVTDLAVAEMRALRAQRVATEQREKVARRNRRGNTQGVGCLLVMLACVVLVAGGPVLAAVSPPLAVAVGLLALLCFAAGVVVFLLGLCL